MIHHGRLAVALAAMAFAAGASASPITFRANASVVTYSNGAGLLPFGASPAATFYVDYTFESTTPATPGFPGVGTYNGALSSYTVVMGGVSFTGSATSGNFIQAIDDYGNPGAGDYQDAYLVGASDFVAPGQDYHALHLFLENLYNEFPVTTGITSTALPLQAFDVSGFTSNTLDFSIFTQNASGQILSYSLQGAVTSLERLGATPTPPAPPSPPPAPSANPLPAPGTLALFLAALGALAVQRRRRRGEALAAG